MLVASGGKLASCASTSVSQSVEEEKSGSAPRMEVRCMQPGSPEQITHIGKDDPNVVSIVKHQVCSWVRTFILISNVGLDFFMKKMGR